MINYAPRAGSTPARVIAHLQGLGAGAELTTAVLADALDLDAPSVGSCLEFARRNGLLARQKREGRVYWSLGDGKPTPDPEDDDPIVRRVVPASAAKSPPTSVRKLHRHRGSLPDIPAWPGVMRAPGANLPPPDPDEQGPVANMAPAAPAPVVSPGTPLKGMRVALWSDGQLQIQRGPADVILFSVEETRTLVRYLERLGESAE